MKTTDVYIVADLSQSMAGQKERIQTEMVQAMLKQLAAEEANGQLYRVTLIGCLGATGWPASNAVPRVTDEKPASKYGEAEVVAALRNAGTNTALRDAIGAACTRIDSKTFIQAPEAVLIAIFSDGEENASTQWSTDMLRGRFEAYKAKGNVTVTFAGPHSALRQLSALAIEPGNFRAWDGSVADLPAVRQETYAMTTSYTTSRAAGQTTSKALYADASKLTTGGVRGYTKQVTPTETKVVSKHMDGRAIADFFKPFEPGKHYYQLVKPEYIQEDKDLVVHIKDQNEYRQGSRTVRILLGLPETGKIRVRPGPHSDKFDIYVQSASVNRKLVEGQKLLTL